MSPDPTTAPVPTADAPRGVPVRPLIEFCGELVDVDRLPFAIGRDADLVLDADNRYLHRRFVAVERRGPVFVLVNVGSQLAAAVTAGGGQVTARLAPGGVMPLLTGDTTVRCTAGPTSYEFRVLLPHVPAAFPVAAATAGREPPGADATVRRAELSPEQKLALLVLAEPALRGGSVAAGALPTNAAAAARLGWTITKFNRKLDNLCAKFAARGVRGLHGGPGRLASYRRSRLVEFAIGSGLISRHDLSLLP